MPTISIPSHGLQLAAHDGENLLKVLRRHQVPIGYSCKRGECGSCKCAVVAGGVELGPHAESALPPAQRAQGLVLACCARERGDVELQLIDSDDYIVHPQRRLVTHVVALEALAPEVYALRLHIDFVDRDGEPFVFSAGQYATLSVRGADGGWIERDFSLAGTPVDAEYDDRLEFHIRRNPHGAFSGLLGDLIAVGSTVYVTGPLGSSHFRPRHAGPLYAVAAGTGLGPMLAIVRTALHNGKLEPVTLYAGFRQADEVYGVAELDALAAEFANFSAHVVVEDGAAPGQRSGRVGDALLTDVARFDGAKVYLAGSPAMVDAVCAALRARGVAGGDLHADAYHAGGARAIG